MFTIKKCPLILSVLLVIVIVPNSVTAEEDQQWWRNVEARVATAKDEFLFGEPVSIKVTLTNTYNETIHFWDSIERCFEFSAVDNSGKPVKTLKNPDISGFFRTVPTAPGTTFNDVVFINEYLEFPVPGVYTVAYSALVPVRKGLFTNGNRDRQEISLSGAATVKIRQGSRSELKNVLTQYLTQLKSKDRRLQSQAARALAVSEPVLAVEVLRKALILKAGSHPFYANYASSLAMWALAKIHTKEAIQTLSDVALHSEHVGARVGAINELGRWHIKESVPTLTEVLADPSPNIRVAALDSLGSIGDKSSIPAIEQRFDDPDEEVRNVARKVYKLLTEGRRKKENNTK